MDKKERHRQQWNDRLSAVRRGLYTDRSIYEVAKEQSKLERQADLLLRCSKGVKQNGRCSKKPTVLRRNGK